VSDSERAVTLVILQIRLCGGSNGGSRSQTRSHSGRGAGGGGYRPLGARALEWHGVTLRCPMLAEPLGIPAD
jgi:uncharacterized membrane protein